MRITVHSVAGKMPRWVDTAVAEYSKRLPRELKLQWRDVPLAARAGGADAAALRQRDTCSAAVVSPSRAGGLEPRIG